MSQATVQRAAEWMARLWSDDASDADRAACAAWRQAHPDHEQAWQRLQVFEHKLASVPARVARQALREAPQAEYLTRRRVLQVLGLAVTAGGAATLVSRTDSWQLAMAGHRTGTGEVRALTLPDGSRVVLASASAIDVQFTAGERLIVLRAGEIMVTSAKDGLPVARPLRVRSRQGTVQALGTRFTVRQQDETSRVAVFEGAVEIRPDAAHGGAAAATAGAAGGEVAGVGQGAAADGVLRVAAGFGARFTSLAATPAGAVQESETAWARGLLVADGMRLDAFLAELARYRPGLLRCAPEVAALRVSGVFSLRDTDRALHNLALALPVSVSYRTRYWVTVQTSPAASRSAAA